MKTLILFGSPRENGNTKDLVNLFINELKGISEIIESYKINFDSCTDCRACFHNNTCSINDFITNELYNKIDEANNIVIASPVYFHSVTGELKRLIDRLQKYWSGHIRGDFEKNYTKKGAYLITGGAPSFENQFSCTEVLINAVFKELSAECVGGVSVAGTDKVAVNERSDITEKVKALAKKLI